MYAYVLMDGWMYVRMNGTIQPQLKLHIIGPREVKNYMYININVWLSHKHLVIYFS